MIDMYLRRPRIQFEIVKMKGRLDEMSQCRWFYALLALGFTFYK